MWILTKETKKEKPERQVGREREIENLLVIQISDEKFLQSVQRNEEELGVALEPCDYGPCCLWWPESYLPAGVSGRKGRVLPCNKSKVFSGPSDFGLEDGLFNRTQRPVEEPAHHAEGLPLHIQSVTEAHAAQPGGGAVCANYTESDEQRRRDGEQDPMPIMFCFCTSAVFDYFHLLEKGPGRR